MALNFAICKRHLNYCVADRYEKFVLIMLARVTRSHKHYVCVFNSAVPEH